MSPDLDLIIWVQISTLPRTNSASVSSAVKKGIVVVLYLTGCFSKIRRDNFLKALSVEIYKHLLNKNKVNQF